MLILGIALLIVLGIIFCAFVAFLGLFAIFLFATGDGGLGVFILLMALLFAFIAAQFFRMSKNKIAENAARQQQALLAQQRTQAQQQAYRPQPVPPPKVETKADWTCQFCGKLNPAGIYDCNGCGAGRTERNP